MALTIHVLDFGDIELETSFLVLGHECGRVRRVPVYGFLITGGTYPVVVDTDEHPRATTLETLAKLRPLFPNGSVTAGNASGINDGAAALVLARASAAEKSGLTPRARILGYAHSGVRPEVMGIGPVPASRKVLARAGLSIEQMDVIELNEAFASQSLAVIRKLGLGEEITNVNGGAIAMGHPLGATGCAILGTLLDELEARNLRYGLATLCGSLLSTCGCTDRNIVSACMAPPF